MSGRMITAAARKRLGEGSICSQCGATLATYADQCNARLDVRCPGFNAIEVALAESHGQ